MAKKSAFSSIASQLDKLTVAELGEVVSIIEALIEVKLAGGDDQEAPDKPEVAAAKGQHGVQGKGGWIETKMIPLKGKKYGPYRYLRYRHNGKKKSVYLGPVG